METSVQIVGDWFVQRRPEYGGGSWQFFNRHTGLPLMVSDRQGKAQGLDVTKPESYREFLRRYEGC